MNKIHRISISLLQNWMEKHMIRQLIETFARDRDTIETIANSVRSLCKHHFEEEFSSKLELLEHLQR